MKKTIRAITMIAALAAMTCVMFACADNGGQKTDLDSLRNQITALENQLNESKGDITDLENQLNESKGDITDLENQIKDLEEQLAGKNVFWTEKEEYGEDETMTVYYGKNAVFTIAFKDTLYGPVWTSGDAINSSLYITSLITDIYVSSILQTAKIEWNRGVYFADQLTSVTICKKNEKTAANVPFDKTSEALENATYFDYVICVPGTPFPLARFKDITVNIRS